MCACPLYTLLRLPQSGNIISAWGDKISTHTVGELAVCYYNYGLCRYRTRWIVGGTITPTGYTPV